MNADPFATLDRDQADVPTSEITMPAPCEPPAASKIKHYQHGTASRVWTYRDAAYRPLIAVVRFDKRNIDGTSSKVVLPFVFEDTAWDYGAPADNRPLYGLDRLAEEPNAPVLIVEGEPAADAAMSLFTDYVAITSQGGAKAAAKSDWAPMRGRDAVLWPDHDKAGLDYVRDVARLLKAAGVRSIATVEVPDTWPEKWDVADLLPPGVEAESLHHMIRTARVDYAGPRRLKVLTPAQCEIGNPRPYVIKGLIARGDHGQFIGQPGSGKSAIAPYAGYCIALGIPFLGMRVRQGRVLYLAAEDGHGMKLRVRALCKRLGNTDDFLLGPENLNLMDPASGDLELVCKMIHEHQPAAVFIDTVARAFPGLRENDSDSMGRVVTVARQLAAEACRPAVLTVHHVAKDAGTTPRGHGILAGDLDVVMLVEGEKAEPRTVRLGKNRNGSSDASFAFSVEAEDFGDDEDGDLLTAPIAAPIDAPASNRKAESEARLNDKATLMLREFRDLVDRYGKPIEPGEGYPTVHGIARTLLRSRLMDRGWFADNLLCAGDDGKMKLERAGYGVENNGLNALKRRGIVGANRLFIWPL